ncbi:RagB/SusD family nutrient uptake outer membrane protein [Arachidicoccus soli]|uniref:RagB/SusD family nutrient uptake outer membrane protein n=1 Tax=Arachidicoccus soli TaxID=2341117 RepID=A0A386HLT2_9BACT|nr:RagB/SusD family nutrient uptake outer membrane protein [Arachidicoccus soli]AYD46451.1 RagB/SusD family nutrient uptake outer membrane protein [Arachidicoccus soli]
MRKKYIIAVFFCALFTGLLLMSCNKNFLEKPRGGTFTVDTVFRTKLNADGAISQMYNLCIPNGLVQNGSNDIPRPDAPTDEIYYIHPTYDWVGATQNLATFCTGNETVDATIDMGGFGSHYSGIRQANLVIKHIGEVTDADGTYKSQAIGQALFCRAIQHFELFRQYGGIPLVTEPLDGTQKLDIRRSSVATTVDSIVSWCDQAAALLPPTWGVADYGRITSLAAKALKARVLLYAASPLYNTPSTMQTEISGIRFGNAHDSVLAYPTYDKGRWLIAAKAAKDVIDAAPSSNVALYNTGKPLTTPNDDSYAGLGDYEAVSNVYANNEMILVNTKNQDAKGGFFWGNWLSSKVREGQWSVKNNVPIEFMQQYEKRDGSSWTLPLSSTGDDLPTWIKSLNLDPRFYQTVLYDGMWYNSTRGVLTYYLGDGGKYPTTNFGSSDAGPDGYALETYKFIARIDNFNDAHFAWPVFRLAEFYLSYAEALNEYQGPSGDPTHYINLIRERAGMPDENISSQDDFRVAVHNERTIELAYEGFRLNDLERWLTAYSVLNETLHGIQTTANASSGSLKRNWKVVSFMTRVFPKKYYYMPFPSADVSENYLGDGSSWNGQNPGW